MTFDILSLDPQFWFHLSQISGWVIIISIVIAFLSMAAPAHLNMWGIIGFILAFLLILSGACLKEISDNNRPFIITPEHSWNTTEIQNITSLGDGQYSSISGGGHFFLGSGSISINGKSSPQYIFYKIMPEGNQIGTMDATNVFVREDENIHPYIEWDYKHTIGAIKTRTDDGVVDYTMNGARSDSLVLTVIHVPNGTITKDYRLGGDLK